MVWVERLVPREIKCGCFFNMSWFTLKLQRRGKCQENLCSSIPLCQWFPAMLQGPKQQGPNQQGPNQQAHGSWNSRLCGRWLVMILEKEDDRVTNTAPNNIRYFLGRTPARQLELTPSLRLFQQHFCQGTWVWVSFRRTCFVAIARSWCCAGGQVFPRVSATWEGPALLGTAGWGTCTNLQAQQCA